MISKRSRYLRCELLREPGVEYLATRPPLDVPSNPDDRFHDVIAGDRLDGLAYQYLGDPKLWWVIAEANDMAWGLDLDPGVTLRIPSMDFVERRVLG